MNQKSQKNKIIKILTIIFLICLISAIGYIVYEKHKSSENKKMYNELQENAILDQTTEDLAEVKEEFVEKVRELQEENPDVKGWIRIEGTSINYPLLQTDNNDYYLTHNYKKEKSSYGSIFINKKSNIKDNNSNVIIYGHNMKNSQMFNELLNYQSKDFYTEHPIIQVATEEGEYNYEIICAFKSRIFYKNEKNVFRYYQYYNFETESKFNEYIKNCKSIQLYDIGKTAKYGEQLITLITCEYSRENGRMVVVARKMP